MSISKVTVIAALFAATSAVRVFSHDDSDKLGRNVDQTIW